MRICLLSYRGNPYCGGQGIYIYYLAKELIRMGHEVHIIVGPPYPDDIEGAIIHRVDNHNYFNTRTGYIRPGDPFATLSPINFYEFVSSKFGIFPEIESFSVRAFTLLRSLVKRYRFDIIHDNQCLGYGFMLIRTLGIPFISTIHHPLTIDRSTWFEYPSDFILKIRRVLYYPLVMQRYVANRMDLIVTVSRDSAEQIHRAFGVPMERIRVVYNGMDSGIFTAVPGIPKKKNSLIFVGNIEDRKKGVLYLLKAMSMTRNRLNLTIVDGGAPGRNLVPRMIDRFGVNGMVNITGKIPISRLIELYARTEIAVVPSLYEGFGFPSAEAMACGVPVIATTGGALPEVVGDHMKTAYIVPPRDAGAIASALDFLVDNPRVRADLARAGKERINRTFTWRKATEGMIDVYREAIHAHRGV